MVDLRLQLKVLSCLLAVGLLLTAAPVLAAEINVVADSSVFSINKLVVVKLILNTEGEDINAVEGTVVFPHNLLKLREIKDSNSFIALWVEKPRLIGDNKIHFAGIIPGGFEKEQGLILTLIFQTQQKGWGTIAMKNFVVLLNDGKGTQTKAAASNLSFVVSNVLPASQLLLAKKDKEPPESFLPMVAKDPTVFNGKYFLVFTAKDKESGIDYYEVCEGGRQCVAAQSPYLLKNQKLNEPIVVKAVDKSGNERAAVVSPLKPIVWYKNYWLFVIILVVILAGSWIGQILWKEYWQKRQL